MIPKGTKTRARRTIRFYVRGRLVWVAINTREALSDLRQFVADCFCNGDISQVGGRVVRDPEEVSRVLVLPLPERN